MDLKVRWTPEMRERLVKYIERYATLNDMDNHPERIVCINGKPHLLKGILPKEFKMEVER